MKVSKWLGFGGILILGIFVGVLLTSKGEGQESSENKVLSTSTKESLAPSVSTIETDSTAASNSSKVIKIIDGDTIVLESGETLRYIGIDAPEKNDCFSNESTAENRRLVEEKNVRLEKDVSEKDRYGRLLRYVYLDDILINDYLVRQGFAKAYRYPPDVKFADQLAQAEQEATENKQGLWNKCEQSPADALTPPPTAKSPGQYSGGDRDCKDFKTHADAQAFFEAQGPGDPHKLDSDGDGLACESLPEISGSHGTSMT